MLFKCTIGFAALGAAFLFIASASAKEQKMPEKYSQSEMRKMVDDSLEKSKVDLESLRDWVFSEVEVFKNETAVVKKNGKKTIDKLLVPSFRKEYAWFVRDGVFVRSPTLIDGTAVNPTQKVAVEEKWFKEQKKRGDRKGLLDYFYDFKRNYVNSIFGNPPTWVRYDQSYFVYPFVKGYFFYRGEKTFEGHKITEIQYVPRASDPWWWGRLIFYIIPEEHQIVRIASGEESDLPNINFVNIASMTMDKWSGTLWLPRKFSVIVSRKNQKTGFYYTREFHSFAKANVKTNITFDDSKDDCTGKCKD